MDQMIIKSAFSTGLINKIIRGIIRKKLGFGVNLDIHEVKAVFEGDELKIGINADAGIKKEDVFKLLTNCGALEE